MSRCVVSFIVGILVGISFFLTFNINFWILYFLFALIISIGFIWLFIRKYYFLLIFSFVLGVSLGGLRVLSVENNFLNLKLNDFESSEVVVRAILLDDPVIKGEYSRAIFRVKDIDGEIFDKKENILVSFASGLPLSYGDAVLIRGKVQRIKNIDKSNFDYVSYEKKDGIIFEIPFAKIERQNNFGGNLFFKKLFSFKKYIESNIEKFLPIPESTIVSGMSIAGKGNLSEEIKQQFINSGLIHVVVLSGYNVALVISFVLIILKGFSLRIKIVTASIFVVLFIYIVGADPPIIRAGITAFIALSGKLFFRKVRQGRALVFTAGVMSYQNPYILIFDPSFILTFLATIAIIWIAPICFKYFSFITEKFLLREIISQTIAVEILVTPFILYKIGAISIIAPLTNILVIPIVSYITILGIIVGIFGFLGFIMYPIALVLHVLVSWVLLVSQLGNFSFASINFTLPIWCVFGLYMLISFVFFVYLPRLQNDTGKA